MKPEGEGFAQYSRDLLIELDPMTVVNSEKVLTVMGWPISLTQCGPRTRTLPRLSDRLARVVWEWTEMSKTEDRQLADTVDYDSPGSVFSPVLRFRTAILLGILAVVFSAGAGIISYLQSRKAMIESIVSHNRIVAKTLSSYADQQSDSEDPESLARVVFQKWDQVPRNHPSIYMCVIGSDGKLIFHSRRRDRVGSYAGETQIFPEEFGRPHTVAGLLQARQDWAGENVNLAGNRQLAAYSYSSKLDGLFVVHTPEETYALDVRKATIPWALGYGVAIFALWPMALLLLHRTFHGATRAVSDATRALAVSEERYRSFIEYSSEGIYLCEFDEPMSIDLPEDEQIKLLTTACHIAACNDAFAQMYGYQSSEEIIGMRAIDVYQTHDNEVNNAFLRDMIRNGYRVHEAISEEYDKQGDRVFFRNNCVGIVANQKLVRVWGTQRDITAQVTAETRLKEKDREVEHLARLSTMGEMIAGIAHEVNQPLYAIGNYALACENLLKDPTLDVPDSLRESIHEISKANTRAGNIIQRIRRFVSKGEVERSLVEVSDFIDEAIQFMDFEARRQLVTVRTHFDSTEALVQVDPGAIEQVMINLLRNAYESLASNPPTERVVEISTSVSQGDVKVTVRDEGPGIPEELAATLFHPFVTSKSEGMGIGLAISQSIIAAHGGELTVHSSPEGASFQFTLPRAHREIEPSSETELVGFSRTS